MMIHGRPSASTTSWTVTIDGWERRPPAARASRRVRSPISRQAGFVEVTGEQDLLDRDLLAQQLVDGAPDGAHAALADPGEQAVTAGDQRHGMLLHAGVRHKPYFIPSGALIPTTNRGAISPAWSTT